jgi:tetratricopeptide (TPR) repeat protein
MSGDNQQKKKPSFITKVLRRKKIFIIIIVVLVIAFGVGGYYWFTKINPNTSNSSSKINTQVVTDTASEAKKVLDNGGKVEDAAQVYEKAISETSDDPTKAALLFDSAILHMNNHDFDEALKDALASEAITPLEAIEKTIAEIYEEKSDVQNAIKYYRKAIELVDKSDPMANSDTQDYQNRIDALNRGELQR